MDLVAAGVVAGGPLHLPTLSHRREHVPENAGRIKR
jgi:hypothetical protein